jgi:hypothetical protein
MTRSPLREFFNTNERLTRLASHFLVAGMMVCLAIAVRNLAERIAPGWQGGYIPWMALLLSAEAQYSRRLVRRESDLYTSSLVYRLGEWVVIGLLIKLFLASSTGLSLFLREMLSWGEGFWANFFDPEYVFVLFLAFVIWYLSGNFAGQLLELEGDRFLLEADIEVGIISDRTAVRRGLALRVLTIGMLMIFITALLRWDYQNLWGERPVPTYSLSYVMVYFVFGLGLITLSHFSARRAVWALERIPISREIGKSWLAYGVLFLFSISLLAFILPTGYSLGLLATVQYLLQLLSQVIYFIFFLLSLPFIYLFRKLAGASEISEVEQPLPSPEFNPPPVTTPVSDGLPWFDLIRSIVFWAIFLAIVVYAFKVFIEQNEYLWQRLRALPGWRYLAAFLNWLAANFKHMDQKVRSAIQGGFMQLSRSGGERPPRQDAGFLKLRTLSPRQKVLFFYLALLRRGQESGFPRQPSQTPFEYAQSLEEALPEVGDDLESLTGAFVEARYSRHTISPDSANLVRHYWGRIKHALRTRQRHKPGGQNRSG